jgi:hypothetical protein
MPTLDSIRRSLAKLDPEERESKEQIIGEVGAVVVGEPRSSAALHELHAARARNTARMFMRRARLYDECLRSSEVQKALDVGRERLRQLRNQGKLIAISRGERRPTLYPYWQFSDEGTVKGLEVILEASKEVGIGPETLHFFMTAPNDGLGGKTPIDVLQEKNGAEQVAGVLRSSGLGPF